jgi:hypothetical protein
VIGVAGRSPYTQALVNPKKFVTGLGVAGPHDTWDWGLVQPRGREFGTFIAGLTPTPTA